MSDYLTAIIRRFSQLRPEVEPRLRSRYEQPLTEWEPGSGESWPGADPTKDRGADGRPDDTAIAHDAKGRPSESLEPPGRVVQTTTNAVPASDSSRAAVSDPELPDASVEPAREFVRRDSRFGRPALPDKQRRSAVANQKRDGTLVETASSGGLVHTAVEIPEASGLSTNDLTGGTLNAEPSLPGVAVGSSSDASAISPVPLLDPNKSVPSADTHHGRELVSIDTKYAENRRDQAAPPLPPDLPVPHDETDEPKAAPVRDAVVDPSRPESVLRTEQAGFETSGETAGPPIAAQTPLPAHPEATRASDAERDITWVQQDTTGARLSQAGAIAGISQLSSSPRQRSGDSSPFTSRYRRIARPTLSDMTLPPGTEPNMTASSSASSDVASDGAPLIAGRVGSGVPRQRQSRSDSAADIFQSGVSATVSPSSTTSEQPTAEANVSRDSQPIRRGTATGEKSPRAVGSSLANGGDRVSPLVRTKEPQPELLTTRQSGLPSAATEAPDISVSPQAPRRRVRSFISTGMPNPTVDPRTLHQGSPLSAATDAAGGAEDVTAPGEESRSSATIATPASAGSPRARPAEGRSSIPIGVPDPAVNPQMSRQESLADRGGNRGAPGEKWRSSVTTDPTDPGEGSPATGHENRSISLAGTLDPRVSLQAPRRPSRPVSPTRVADPEPRNQEADRSRPPDKLGYTPSPEAQQRRRSPAPVDIRLQRREPAGVSRLEGPSSALSPPGAVNEAPATRGFADAARAVGNSPALPPTPRAPRQVALDPRLADANDTGLSVPAHRRMASVTQPEQPLPAMSSWTMATRPPGARRLSNGLVIATGGAFVETPGGEYSSIQRKTFLPRTARDPDQAASPELPSTGVLIPQKPLRPSLPTDEPPRDRAANLLQGDRARLAPNASDDHGTKRLPAVPTAAPTQLPPGLLSRDFGRRSTQPAVQAQDSPAPYRPTGGWRGALPHDEPATEAPPPRVEVTIGRVEIHAAPETAQGRPNPRPRSRRIGIDDYLRRKTAQTGAGDAP
jgi:hypothetical protein